MPGTARRRLNQRLGAINETIGEGGPTLFVERSSEPAGRPTYLICATLPSGEEIALVGPQRAPEAVRFVDGIMAGIGLVLAKKKGTAEAVPAD